MSRGFILNVLDEEVRSIIRSGDMQRLTVIPQRPWLHTHSSTDIISIHHITHSCNAVVNIDTGLPGVTKTHLQDHLCRHTQR